MNFRIRPFTDEDLEAIIQLSLLAWEPVYRSFKQILGPEIYPLVYPDWQRFQKENVAKTCQDKETVNVLVAETERRVVGFLAYELRHKDATGEVQLLAVYPEYRDQGLGKENVNWSKQWPKRGPGSATPPPTAHTSAATD